MPFVIKLLGMGEVQGEASGCTTNDQLRVMGVTQSLYFPLIELGGLHQLAAANHSFHEDKPVLIELPASVDVTITDTPPNVKGATATNQLKDATCDTGLKTRVPPFIEIGEKVRVSTADGSYMSRVKGE